MEDLIGQALSYDPIGHAEKICDKQHWSQFDDGDNALALFLNMRSSENKEKLLKESKDTYFNMPWSDFKQLLLSNGFKIGYEYDIEHYDNECGVEEAIVYYHIEKGLIVFADSYGNKDHINSGHLYGEVTANDNPDDKQTVWSNISTGGMITETERTWTTQQDVREGLFYKIHKLESGGKFVPIWIDDKRYIRFVDFAESHNSRDKFPDFQDLSNHYNKITNNIIEKLPKEARTIMNK